HGTMLMRARPRQSLLHLPKLDQGLFRDRKRLYEHADLAQARRKHIHVLFVIHDQLSHESVRALDAALGEIAGVAEVLTSGAAGDAIPMRTGPTHHRHHEVPVLDARNIRADFHYLSQRFVPNYKFVLAGGRDAVLETGDLAIRAADAHFEHAQLR